MIFGFSVLTYVTVLTYSNAPPIPRQIVDGTGGLLFTGEDIEKGQEVFLRHALMEHGTLWGHGAYLGPDYTAEYLHREVGIARDLAAKARQGKPYALLSPAEQSAAADEVRAELKVDRFDAGTGTLRFSPGQAAASRALEGYWADYFSKENSAPGLPPGTIADPGEIRLLNAYLAWATWATVANRPGKDYTYTNNWPYDPDAGNRPSTHAYVWSALSLVTLLGGLGLVLLIFGKYHFLGWGGEGTEPRPGPVSATMRLTPSQRATAKYFAVVALLFLLQAAVGGALAHYRAEPFSFYGVGAILQLAPYNLLRTWHLQLAIFWIATAWVAGGLFLAPLVGGEEPPGQKQLVDLLFVALVVVVGGSLVGQFLSLRGGLERTWFWLGHQGSEYLDLGRFWQLLLAVGLLLWLFLMFRALRPTIRREGGSEISALFLYAGAAIPFFYLPALFYAPAPTSRSSTTGGSGSFTCGWRASSSCSPRCSSPSCSARSGSSRRGPRPGSCTSTPSSSWPEASSGRGTTGTSRARAR
jgi:nitric oxide reductase subunit B